MIFTGDDDDDVNKAYNSIEAAADQLGCDPVDLAFLLLGGAVAIIGPVGLPEVLDTIMDYLGYSEDEREILRVAGDAAAKLREDEHEILRVVRDVASKPRDE